MTDAERALITATAHAVASLMDDRERANALLTMMERVEKAARPRRAVPPPLGTPEQYAGVCGHLAGRIRARLDGNKGPDRSNTIPLTLAFARELVGALDAAALLLNPSPKES